MTDTNIVRASEEQIALLIDELSAPDEHSPGNFDTPKRANAYLSALCQTAATQVKNMQTELEAYRRAFREPYAWIHEHGHHTVFSHRQLDNFERDRGWTERPLAADPFAAPTQGEEG